MTAAERLQRAAELLDQAVAELEAAEEDAPAYVTGPTGPLAFLRAELKVARRRIENCARVLSTSSRRTG